MFLTSTVTMDAVRWYLLFLMYRVLHNWYCNDKLDGTLSNIEHRLASDIPRQPRRVSYNMHRLVSQWVLACRLCFSCWYLACTYAALLCKVICLVLLVVVWYAVDNIGICSAITSVNCIHACVEICLSSCSRCCRGQHILGIQDWPKVRQGARLQS